MGLNPTTGTVLGFLLSGPRTAWDIDQHIGVSVGHFWNVTRSQVYRELPQLASEGLVRIQSGGGKGERRTYAITAQGRMAFRRWLAEGPPAETRRIPILLLTFFGAELEPKRLAEILDQMREQVTGELKGYEEVEPLLADRPFERATLDFGLRYARLVRDWIDEVARPLVDEGPASPTG
jgi:DNA-binding PadR family transcriptional regulator